jgi:hypothetical protein
MATENLDLSSDLWNSALRRVHDPLMAAAILELFEGNEDLKKAHPGVYLMARNTLAHQAQREANKARRKATFERVMQWLFSTRKNDDPALKAPTFTSQASSVAPANLDPI